ncbi:MAG: polysaccharide pyruvyl transferase family protein [Clostridia bacterium]|nr:polysaccharide pyruvyl transferase family protein [Clostridia bacterium]
MKKKIVIFGVFNDPNLGDVLLCLSSGKIVKKFCDAEIEYVDFYGRECLSPKYPRVKTDGTVYTVNWSPFYSVFHKAFSLMSLMNYPIREIGCHFEWLTDPNRKKRLEKYYNDKIKDADMVIVPGGGVLEDSVEHDYYHNILLMSEACKKRGIPMCFNAVGIVSDKRASLGKKLLKKALMNESVKYISCRDGEEKVKSMTNLPVKTVACAATMAGELFRIKKDDTSDKIGIGVIRGNVFETYGYSLSEDELINFYVELVGEVEKKGYKAQLFCNGFIKDYELGCKVCERLGKDILLKRPETSEELIEHIAGFKAICVARLHAAITAYSLDIPAVVFSWGTKQKDFMAQAGCAYRAIACSDMDAEYVVKVLCEAIENGWDKDKRTAFTKTGVDSIREILAIGGFIDE